MTVNALAKEDFDPASVRVDTAMIAATAAYIWA